MALRRLSGRKLGYRQRYVFDWLRPGDIALDCGANVGKVTALMRARGAIVHAFEPDPVAYAVLEEKFGDDAGVVLHNAAVGAEAGEASLFFRSDREDDPVKATIGSSLYASNDGLDGDNFIRTQVIDLGAYIAGLGADVAILKMDIEGHEIPTIAALIERNLCARIGLGLIETHGRYNPDLVEPTAKMARDLSSAGATQFYLNWR